jgi:hypothetical protein
MTKEMRARFKGTSDWQDSEVAGPDCIASRPTMQLVGSARNRTSVRKCNAALPAGGRR